MTKGIFHICIVMICLSCGTSGDVSNEVESMLSDIDTDVMELEGKFDGRFLKYGAHKVSLNSPTKDHTFSVQKIEETREDITYRAKRIDTETYLLNKGVEGNELTEALKDLNNDQLFYIEFQETLKQDLIKKYFKGNKDKPVSYLAFDIQEDFKLVNSSGDTIKANYSMYERNYHVAPFERLLLNFSGISSGEALTILYKDKIFGKGDFIFEFPSDEFIITHTQNVL